MLSMNNINKIVAFHLTLLAVLALAGGYSYAKYWNVATVNGKPISRIDYIKTMEKAGGKQTLDQMVQDSLVLSEGQKSGIKMSKEEVNAEVAKVEERIKAQGQTLDSALAMSNMTRQDLEKQILMQKIESTLAVSKAEITQAQIDEFLKTYKSQLPTNMNKTQLQDLAKEELTTQASKSAAADWLTNLTKNAKIIYK